MNFECEYCNKTFNLKGNMIKHQKTAKYCIVIQKSTNNNNKVDHISYDCEFCDKKFTQAIHLYRHTPICLDKYKFEIGKKNVEIFELKEKVANLKEKVKIIQLETENRILRDISKENRATINEIAIQPNIQTNTNNNDNIMIATPIDIEKDLINKKIKI